ncbi:GerD family protein [Mesorhizobium sp. M7A.F.Ca.MR.362.00.0.0]|uniref:GerD family protein n=1 Tax=Mesorhizobium sp. M7A.F.Ca.MR.362.00.0.0 TaxID=2496779 RepID=UPI0034D1C0F6
MLKSTEYREHLMQVMQESMDTPEFKKKFQEMLDKAAKEAASNFNTKSFKI